MSGNGAVARVRVQGHFEDDIAEAMDRLQQLDLQLARAVEAYRIDRSDDPLQVANIEQLQALKDQEAGRIAWLRRQIKALNSGRAIDGVPVQSPTVVP